MADPTCRSGRHPISERVSSQDGRHVDCRGCARDRDRMKYQRHGQWADPAPDPERARWLAAWQASIDQTIARIRREEGFNGRRQRWQTLGEYLRPDTALRTQMRQPGPERPEVVARRFAARCRDCGAPCRNDASCDFCRTVLRIRRAS